MADKELPDCPPEWRQEFTDDEAEWADTRSEGQKDMRFVSGDPWDPVDRAAREAAGRICLTSDELGQYVNQAINDLRQNKRGIRVSPIALGANSQTANFRQALIRQIEYRSNAQQAYMVMAENMFQRGYGFLRIIAKFAEQAGEDASPAALNQDLWIDPVVNPDMVTPDPYATRSDGSDMTHLWYRESWSKGDFERKWPDADINPSLITADVAKSWITGNRVTVAEKWVKERIGSKTLHLLKPADENGEPQAVWADPKNKPSSDQILRSREIEQFQVKQYLTNGLQILEENLWPGTAIPWVTCYGKILYVESARQILSMVRLARDPYMLYCYMVTCQGEVVGAIPRNAWIGYKGQFHNPLDWQKAAHEPMVYLEANAITEQTGGQVLPLPQRQPWDPPLGNLELAKEAARRAIQAAMGSSPLPTEAQRKSQKTGIALQRIEESGQRGTFHFVDHFDDAIVRTGALLDELIPHYYDTARDVAIRKDDDSPAMVRINDPSKVYSDGLEEGPGRGSHIDASQGVHDVTISVAPAMASQREQNSDFADSVLQNQLLINLMGPQKAKKLASLAVKLKAAGPIGDAIADLLDPPEAEQGGPEQAAQLQQQNQQLQQQLQQAAFEIKAKTAGAQINADVKLQTEQMRIASDERLAAQESADKAADREVKLAVAELGAKVDRIALFLEERARLGTQAHDAALLAQEHAQALEAGELGHQQAMAQQAAQPQPESVG